MFSFSVIKRVIREISQKGSFAEVYSLNVAILSTRESFSREVSSLKVYKDFPSVSFCKMFNDHLIINWITEIQRYDKNKCVNCDVLVGYFITTHDHVWVYTSQSLSSKLFIWFPVRETLTIIKQKFISAASTKTILLQTQPNNLDFNTESNHVASNLDSCVYFTFR